MALNVGAIEAYMETRPPKFPEVKLTPKAPRFVDRRGDRIKRGGAHYLVERSFRGRRPGRPCAGRGHGPRPAAHLRHPPGRRRASATEIQVLLGHESLNTSQGYSDATANATRQAVRANRTYRALDRIPRAEKAGSRAC